MTDEQVKSMLKDIINNGSEYECKPNFECDTDGCDICRYKGYCDWRPYKLGDEIHPDWEYRKVEKWYVFDYEDNDYRIFKDDIDCAVPVVFEGSKEACEKWVKEHTKKIWLEERKSCLSLLFERKAINCYETGVKEVCKKILEEVDSYKWNYDDYDMERSFDVIEVSDIHKVIKDLGVEL